MGGGTKPLPGGSGSSGSLGRFGASCSAGTGGLVGSGPGSPEGTRAPSLIGSSREGAAIAFVKGSRELSNKITQISDDASRFLENFALIQQVEIRGFSMMSSLVPFPSHFNGSDPPEVLILLCYAGQAA
jgi:hypothetical protein